MPLLPLQREQGGPQELNMTDDGIPCFKICPSIKQPMFSVFDDATLDQPPSPAAPLSIKYIADSTVPPKDPTRT